MLFRSEEQKQFRNFVAMHLKEKDSPLMLEGGTGLGKTRAYLSAIASCQETVAIVLPTHQLIDQLLTSKDIQAVQLEVEAHRPARMFDGRIEYINQLKRVLNSRVMLCTAASVMIDQRLRGNYNGSTLRDYLLFDEADQLPQAAALQQDLTITREDLKSAGVSHSDIDQMLSELIASKNCEPEVRARALIIKEALDEPAWYHETGLSDDGEIRLYHRLPGRLLKRIANKGNTAFISATLSIKGTFSDFQRSMGVGQISRFSSKIEPANHGDIEVETPTDLSATEVILQAERPCLVVVPSHEQAQQLGSEIPDAIVRQREETTSSAAERVTPEGILIAAGAWAGLDTPLHWKSIVVPKIPFERPTILDEQVESRYVDSKNVAIRRMRQVVGRGIRTPDAKCTIYILDKRYSALEDFLPDRFKNSFREGKRQQVILSKSERNPAVRKAALKHYGLSCQACGMVPLNSSILDVHHLDPIAEGERQTRIEDVIPLCANCHRLAHTKNPPIPISEIKALLAD